MFHIFSILFIYLGYNFTVFFNFHNSPHLFKYFIFTFVTSIWFISVWALSRSLPKKFTDHSVYNTTPIEQIIIDDVRRYTVHFNNDFSKLKGGKVGLRNSRGEKRVHIYLLHFSLIFVSISNFFPITKQN